MQRKGRSRQETIVQPSSSRDTQNNTLELFTEPAPTTNGRCQHSSFQSRSQFDNLKKLIKRPPKARLKEPGILPSLLSPASEPLNLFHLLKKPSTRVLYSSLLNSIQICLHITSFLQLEGQLYDSRALLLNFQSLG